MKAVPQLSSIRNSKIGNFDKSQSFMIKFDSKYPVCKQTVAEQDNCRGVFFHGEDRTKKRNHDGYGRPD
jgi:hypothetical protein